MSTTRRYEGSATQLVLGEDDDLETMASLGLGGSAVAAGLQFEGAMAIDLKTLRRLAEADSIRAETLVCLDHVRDGLALTGRDLGDIVRITLYVSDEAYCQDAWSTLRSEFGDGQMPKCLTLVAGIAGDCRVELEVVAYRAEESAA